MRVSALSPVSALKRKAPKPRNLQSTTHLKLNPPKPEKPDLNPRQKNCKAPPALQNRIRRSVGWQARDPPIFFSGGAGVFKATSHQLTYLAREGGVD